MSDSLPIAKPGRTGKLALHFLGPRNCPDCGFDLDPQGGLRAAFPPLALNVQGELVGQSVHQVVQRTQGVLQVHHSLAEILLIELLLGLIQIRDHHGFRLPVLLGNIAV
jgi:hypothetical protein